MSVLKENDSRIVLHFHRVYEQCLEPLQDHLLKLHAHEKIMKHLSHPIKQVSFQVQSICVKYYRVRTV